MVAETLVLGGGLAGGAAALLLARAGEAVRLIEREREPRDKICGEFLSIEAQHDLQRLGIDPAALGAVPVDRVRVSHGRHTVEAPLPFAALGLSRKLLDEALLEAAARAGARIERGVRVSSVGRRMVATSMGELAGEHVLLATGKHDLRGARRTGPATRGGYVGFKMHWRVAPADAAGLAGVIELVLLRGGYAGLQLVAPCTLNLCLIIRRERLHAAGSGWDALLAELLHEPALARRLGAAEPLLHQPLTIANLPYGYVCTPQAGREDHLFRLGDQAAMTASLTGDGMALALRSAFLAAESLAAGTSPAAYHERIGKLAATQVRRAMLLQRLTETPLGMLAGSAVLRLWPRLLTVLAGATRLPRWREG